MGQAFFRFRQFEIRQEHAAMRVSTDSVLLGAWATQDNPRRILDIGTGTGVLALIMAQRFPLAHIDAVEIAEDALLDADHNFRHSPWKDRLRLHGADFRSWESPVAEGYDLIISNPPYFRDSLLPDKSGRRKARHQTDLHLFQLIARSRGLMGDQGRLAMILPLNARMELEEAAIHGRLFLREVCRVRTTPNKPDSRIMVSLSREEGPLVQTQHSLLLAGGQRYSPEHEALTRELYLSDDQ